MRKGIATFGLVVFLLPSALQAGGWGRGRLWDDGRAEVAAYDAEQTANGKPRAFREYLITAREEMPGETKKTRAFKLNQVQKIEAENYPTAVLTSVLVKEETPQQVVNISVGAQDWRGNTFKLYKGQPEGTGGTLTLHADAGGDDQSTELQLVKDDYFEDQLPLSLRALPFKEGFEKKIRLWGALAGMQAQAPLVAEAVLAVTGEEILHCHAGAIPAWIVTIKKAGGTDTYWFEKADPNLLVKMETHDGRRRMLYGRARWTYWDPRLPRPTLLN